MIRTKSYVLREIRTMRRKKRRLQEELRVLNAAGDKEMFRTSAKVIQHEVDAITAKIEFGLWIANTSEKDLPKIKKKRKSQKVKPRT